MATELRKTGISVVGDMPWGTHFCYFYETKQDLFDILVPYFKAGLENNEFCLWVVSKSELLTMPEATSALRTALPDLDRYLAEGSLEVVAHDEWFLNGGAFDIHRVANRFKEKLDEALTRGYTGMRVNGSPAWLQEKDEKEWREFEEELDKLFPNERIIASCTYQLGRSGADFLLDVARHHQFAIARRRGNWDVLETPELIQAKQEIKRLNEELEQRVIERTRELDATNEELRREISERKRAEEALKESERKLEESQRIAHVGHWERDLETGLVTWSDETYRIFGLPLQGHDLPLTEWQEMLHPEDRERVSTTVEEAKRGIRRYDFEYRLVRPEGEVRFIHCQGDLIRDEQGRPRRAFGIAQDITERKQVEQRLREYEKAVEGLDEMITVIDRDYRYLLANRALLAYRGLKREQLVGQLVPEVLNPGVFENVVKEKLKQCFQGSVVKYEMKYNYPELGERDLSVSYFPIEGPTGIERVACVLKDITESKRAEEQLKQSEHQLAEAQRLAHIGSWNWDLRSNTVTWSDEIYRIFGVDPQAFNPAYEETIMESIHPEDRALVRGAVAISLQTQEPSSFYYRILRPDGEERVIHSRGDIVSDEHGNPIRMFGTAQDVTERKRAEEHLRATTEQLRSLSASLQSAREEEGTRIAREIHDELGAALTSLRWDLESFDKIISEAGDQSQFQALRERIEAMLRLTETTISSVRRISSELRPSVLDDLGLVEAIEWQAQQFQARTGIISRCDCSLENLDLSREQSTAVFRILQEALTNILRHAQATRVDIMMKEEDGEFVLTIIDNGRGITEDEKSGSQSLGLLGMRERAHLIGGKINITGVKGKGTVITVRVPISV